MSLQDWTYVPEGSPTPDQYDVLEYSEQINSGNITSTPSNSSITRTFYIAHSLIPVFLDDLLGYAVVGNDNVVERPSLPDQHPLFSNYFAQEVSVEGVGISATGSVQYSNKTAKSTVAKVTAVYKSIDYEIVPDQPAQAELYRFVSRTINYSGEYFTVNSTGMKYVSNTGTDGKNKSLSISPSRISGQSELTYVWRMVPPCPATSPFVPPNKTAIANTIGKVHLGDDNFDANFFNAPDGTVLCLGVEPKCVAPRVTTGAVKNNIFWEITAKFLYRNNGFVNRTTTSGLLSEYAGHMFAFDMGLERWDLITHNGRVDGNRLYQTADLNTVFTIG